MEELIRRGAYDDFAGEFIAYMTMQFIVAYCLISSERRGDFYRECARIASEAGKYRPSRELNRSTRGSIAYVYRVLRHLPYWCGAAALLPLVMLKNPTLKKVIRKLTTKK